MPITRRMPVAKAGEIPDGGTKSFSFGPWKGLAIHRNGTLKAFINRCTHMGGPVEMMGDGSSLRCRWHGADFHPETGEAIEGQAPQGTALQKIELIEEGGEIFAVLELPEDGF